MGRQVGGLFSRVPWTEIIEEARQYLDMLDVSIDVTRPMQGLSIANQQMVEIARSLASDSKLIIMDEPPHPLHHVRLRLFLKSPEGYERKDAQLFLYLIGWKR